MADGVAAERGLARLGDERADVVEDDVLGLLQRHAGVELVDEAGGRVHVADEVVHLLEGLVRRLDDDVDAVAELVELEVRDEGGHLHQGVGLQGQARHLAVDPDDPVGDGSVVGVAHRSTIEAEGDGPPRRAGARPAAGQRDCTSLPS